MIGERKENNRIRVRQRAQGKGETITKEGGCVDELEREEKEIEKSTKVGNGRDNTIRREDEGGRERSKQEE